MNGVGNSALQCRRSASATNTTTNTMPAACSRTSLRSYRQQTRSVHSVRHLNHVVRMPIPCKTMQQCSKTYYKLIKTMKSRHTLYIQTAIPRAAPNTARKLQAADPTNAAEVVASHVTCPKASTRTVRDALNSNVVNVTQMSPTTNVSGTRSTKAIIPSGGFVPKWR